MTDITYFARERIRFLTPEGRELEGQIVLLADDCALVKVEKPIRADILIDIDKIVGKVGYMKATQPPAST